MSEEQMEINIDGNEQLKINLSENKVDNTNCSKFSAYKVYADNVKKTNSQTEKTL